MKTIAILGFGNVGQNLAKLFNDAGYRVIVCSKSGDAGKGEYLSMNYLEGINAADAVALAVPYQVLTELLAPLAKHLAGKTVIDCTNPLNDDWSPLLLGQETSAAEQIGKLLPDAKVIKAFNTIFADVMPKKHHDREGKKITAFVAGDDLSAKNNILALAKNIGFAPLDVGPLSAARYLEAMAHLNIQIAVGQQGGTQAAFIYHQGN
ncbi:NADPH-dependent F420 reductase [Thalassotalea loyana]|uniref:NADPH-dependent F420 reductase n=1 Tax=Thalassotalea loyana TaxID=280483 RepID=A0ABQ6HFW2_9GAMM|nr:NADPH-dependent F420 reductase [Thalassotalea loyana]GLX86973.1 NADPH-dependent F420 reductase [Thalassotalea loyana]